MEIQIFHNLKFKEFVWEKTFDRVTFGSETGTLYGKRCFAPATYFPCSFCNVFSKSFTHCPCTGGWLVQLLLLLCKHCLFDQLDATGFIHPQTCTEVRKRSQRVVKVCKNTLRWSLVVGTQFTDTQNLSTTSNTSVFRVWISSTKCRPSDKIKLFLYSFKWPAP